MLESFRRHQKKWLAALALMAMFAFTLDFSLLRNSGGPAGGSNPVVFKVAGRDVRAHDLDALKLERVRANVFLQAFGYPPDALGGTSDAAMRDAYILDREAARLGIPGGPDVGAAWLRQTFPTLTAEAFQQIYQRTFTEGQLACSDTQLLADLGSQVRLNSVRTLPLGLPQTTPLDIFDRYRDQSESVSALAVPFPVDEYVARVGEPSEADVQAFYDRHKNELPDPSRDTPGFMRPRRVQVEYVTIDEVAIEKAQREALTDEALRDYYRQHQSEPEFQPPPPEMPVNVFAGDPEAKLTPNLLGPFERVRDRVLDRVAADRTREAVEAKLGPLRDEVMAGFLTRHDDAKEANRLAREAGRPEAALPQPVGPDGTSLMAAAAAKAGLPYTKTPLLAPDQAAQAGVIAGATAAGARLDDPITFERYVFDPRNAVFESFDLVDAQGRRHLGWKLQDLAPAVPPLDEIKGDVVLAWKRQQARALAEKDAQALAEKAKATGDLRVAAAPRAVISTRETARMVQVPEFRNGQITFDYRTSEIAELPHAGPALRDAVFALQPGQFVVSPDAPRMTYYVLGLNQRLPARMEPLFSPIGFAKELARQHAAEASREQVDHWMDYLREKAGAGPILTRGATAGDDAPEAPPAEG